MKAVSAIGHFALGKVFLDGQTIKTKIITEELQRQLGQAQVSIIDTHGGLKTLAKAPHQCLSALQKSRNVVIFPAHNGLRVYAPLLSRLRHFFKGRRLHYVVIGGWLPQFLQKRKHLAKALRGFDAIYVETSTMKAALEAQGFGNIFVMPNCKKLEVLSEDELVYPQGLPLKLCTFSRVMKEKGIGDAVEAVRNVNAELGYEAYTLDIYGQVDPAQTEWFEALKSSFTEGVRYCGCVDANKSVQALQGYFALLFPTHFYTEGIPGTIIDAYAAGVPVISAKWESYSDVVEEGITGFGYEFDEESQLEDILVNAAAEPDMILKKKSSCLREAEKYKIEQAVKVLLGQIEDG